MHMSSIQKVAIKDLLPIPSGTSVVYKENGQIAWTRTVRADPEAEPIVGVS